MKQQHPLLFAAVALIVSIAGCAAPAPAIDYDAATQQMMKSSFRDQGIATVDRLQQDEADAACSKAQGAPLPEAQRVAIEAANMKTVRMPSDGQFLGDWKVGEQLAQNGRGMTWSDPAGVPSGGNCYNCHQITKEEISFGTIGPSLYQYGKLRGVTDPNSAAARPVVEYTWGKIWNSRAYAACSNMPRAGHSGILSEQQVKHVVALLLDPNSPVNK